MKCKHDWEMDERMKGDGVMMFFGKIGEVKREWRYICNLCGEVKYE